MEWAATVLLVSCCVSVQGADSVRLSSLDLSMMTTGWGQAHANRSIDGNRLTIAGKQYEYGVGTHAASRFAVAINGATRFTAQVGVDDEVTSAQASVEFVILVDGKQRWRSGVMKRGDAAKAVDVALTGAEEMVLMATDGGDGSSYDHANWADAQFVVSGRAPEPAANKRIFRVTTANSTLTLLAGEDGRLYQLGYGPSDRPAPLPRRGPTRENEFYPPFGNGFILEPAVQATHRDGNTSVDLMVAGSTAEKLDDNVTLTRIELKDGHYPFSVTLCLKAYWNEDVIEQWAEIRHNEDGPVTLFRFASSSASLVAPAQGYWLTHFHGDWADEAQWVEERLSSGIKILDSKIGVRAHQYRTPMFMLALDHAAREDVGEVYGGTLAWSGSFQFAFEIGPWGHLRVLSGINPLRLAVSIGPRRSVQDARHAVDLQQRGQGSHEPELPSLGPALRCARWRYATARAAEQLGSNLHGFR